MIDASMPEQGYYSILRWRRDATQEGRNIAIVLVQDAGRFGGIRAAPISGISKELHEQGILDAILQGLEASFAIEPKPTTQWLTTAAEQLQRSLYLTTPEPVAVSDPQVAIDALYRAYVASTT